MNEATPAPARAQRPGPAATAVVFVFLAWVFFASEHGFGFLRHEDRVRSQEKNVAAAEEGQPVRRAAFLLLGIGGLVSLLRQRRNPLRSNGLLGWVILAFWGWSWLSLAWADDVPLSFRRLILLAMLCVGALAMGRLLSLRRIVLFAILCTAGYLVMGLGGELLLGTFTPWAPTYRFAGTLHPNMQGLNCAVLLLGAACLAQGVKRGRGWLLAVAGVALLFLVLTKSRAAFASALLSLGTYAAVVWSGRRKLALFISLGVIVCLFLLLVGDTFFPALGSVALLGRQDAGLEGLTGRVPLWELCMDYASRQPWVGYGYNSFFNPERLKQVGAELAWLPNEAHSVYLDLLLGVGVVGLFLFVVILLTGIIRSFIYHAGAPRAGYAFLAMVLVLCALNGLLESAVGQARLVGFLSWAALTRLGFRGPAPEGQAT